MDLFIESNQIYSSQTREYFKEVLNSYSNGNYRSAVVMLYSVCICDILFKLEELRDLYSDKIAESILFDVDNKKLCDESKSTWEKLLLDRVIQETNLIDVEGKIFLSHLYDWRNLSAHPVINGSHCLSMPQATQVAAFIRASLDCILLKPAIFTNDVIEVLAEDLVEKKIIFHDKEVLWNYIDKKYLSRLSDAAFIKTFRAFWKFTFRLDNIDCSENRNINLKLLKHMLKSRKSIITCDINANPQSYEINTSKVQVVWICHLLAEYPNIFLLLPEVSQAIIKTASEKDCNAKFISWFICKNKLEHLENLRMNPIIPNYHSIIYFFAGMYEKEGYLQEALCYYIELMNTIKKYSEVDPFFDKFIFPYINKMSLDTITKLIYTMDSNSYVYGKSQYTAICTNVWEQVDENIKSKIDLSSYNHFTIKDSFEDFPF